MRKEVIAAVIVGGLLGVFVAFGVWRANTVLTTEPVENTEDEPTEAESEAIDKDTAELALSSPDNNQVVTDSAIEVTGITTPDSPVLVIGEDADAFAISNSDGSFTIPFELTAGTNQIEVFAFDNGQEKRGQRMVIFSSQFAETEAAEDPEERAEERVEQSSNPPVAELGTVTDITDTTVEMRTEEGALKQLSIDEETTYVNVIGDTEEVAASDLAIGDYVIAMGFNDDTDVLSARRILIDTPTSADIDRLAAYGDVTAFSASEFLIDNGAIGVEWSIDATGDDVTTYQVAADGELASVQISTIDEGDIVIISGQAEDELLARSIYILFTPEEQEVEEPNI